MSMPFWTFIRGIFRSWQTSPSITPGPTTNAIPTPQFLHTRLLTSLDSYTQAGIIADVIGVEGGYVNDPTDRGGETNWGITAQTAAKYKTQLVAQFEWDGTMRNLSQPMATYVYTQEYWNPMNLDQVMAISATTPLLADLLFEAGVNLGTSTVVKFLQQSLNVLNNRGALYGDLIVDGGLGNGTLDALRKLISARPTDGLENLLFMVSALIGARYINIATADESQEKYVSGWENRARNQYNAYVLLLGSNG
jgi:lysozyme family protein